MTTRRDFLTGAATTGIAAATLATFPESIRRALAIPAFHETGTIKDVKHVVILMQENRAFDHYFGTLKGVRGFGDRFTIPQSGDRTVWQQQRSDGSVITPYHLDETKGNAQRTFGTPHTWGDAQAAWDNGRLSNWPVYKSDTAMGYFTDAEVPFQFALANAFTLCDAYHCSIHTGTDSNRSYFFTGTNGATPHQTAFVNNEWDWIDGDPATVDVGYTWTTYAERLEGAGVSWISYQNMPDEWGDNMLGAFRTFRHANINSGFPVSSGGAPNEPYADTGQPLPYHAYDPSTDNANNPLYKGVANTLPGNAPEEYLDAFKRDIREGRLPQVSWINAPSIYCEHPGPSSPVQGAWFVQEVLNALTAVPEVWSKTVLLVNFDENDGYFDHVPAPTAPSLRADGTYAGKTTLSADAMSDEYYNHPAPPGSRSQPRRDGRPYGPGPRVPLWVISPWSRGGWVNSQTFDHTSVIRFLEARFGVKEPNISAYRRAISGDLTRCFNFASPNNEPLPTLAGQTTRDAADALVASRPQTEQVPLPVDATVPVQAAGFRPSRALPYVLHASAHVDAAKGAVTLLFVNTGFAAAVFHVYDKKHLDRIPQRYAVEAGKALEDTWTVDDDGQYDLWVLGPNGFHRYFKGDLSKVQAKNAPNPEIFVGYDVFGGGVHLQLRNDGGGNVKFTVKSNKIYGPLFAVSSAVSAFGPAPSFPGFGPAPALAPAGFGAAPGFGPGRGFGPGPGFGVPVFGAPGFGFPPAPGFVAGPVFGPGAGTSWSVAAHAGRPSELYWNLGATGFWYDFVVQSDSDGGFSRRFAGRVETGRHSVSDPGMGLADKF